MKTNSVKEFIAKKTIENALGKDHIFERASKSGIDNRTMFYYPESDIASLYYGQKKTDNTYISLSEEVFNKVDEETFTLRENYEVKNNIINTLITANALINDMYPGDSEPMSEDPETMLKLILDKEPGIDLRGVAKIFDLNELFRFVCITTAEGAEKSEEGESEPTSETGLAEPSEEEPAEVTLEKLDGVISGEKTAEDPAQFFTKHNIIAKNSPREKEIEVLANRLSSKLKGVYGKQNILTPSKKLNIRNYVRGSQYYYKKKRTEAAGKKITMNIIVDCSGSMSGRYIKDAISLCMIMNHIARVEKTISGNIILSASEGAVVMDIKEVTYDLLNKAHAFSGEEGIANTLADHQDKLLNTDYNICITDASITDSIINKKAYESRNIFIDGIYIGDVNKKTIKEHEEHMDQYFSRSKILKTLDDAVEYIISVAMRT